MARSANAAATVLESLRVLHGLGADPDLADGDVIIALAKVGIAGLASDEEPYLSMVGTMLRLLLRHAGVEPDVMFHATFEDLAELGRDIDDEKFREIPERFDSD
jgi:hypothetical protein